MKKMILLPAPTIIVLAVLIFAPIASATKIKIENGQGVGVNLIPLFPDSEYPYHIIGCGIIPGEIKFSVEGALIGQIESPLLYRVEDEQVSFQIVEGKNYLITIPITPQQPGFLKVRIETPVIDATIWLKVLAQGTPLPWDANWDGVLDLRDAQAVLNAIKNPTDDVNYWRADVNCDILAVDWKDLVLIRKKLGLMPYDFNDDGKVDIRDFAFVSPQPKKPNLDANQDGIVDIHDLVFRFRQSKIEQSPPCFLSFKATAWGSFKQDKQ